LDGKAVTSPEAIRRAATLHDAGHFEEAEALLRDAITAGDETWSGSRGCCARSLRGTRNSIGRLGSGYASVGFLRRQISPARCRSGNIDASRHRSV